MNKRWTVGLFSVLSGILAMPVVHADVYGSLNSIITKMIEIGSLNFLGVPNGSMLIMFTRLLIGLLIFTILFAVSSSFVGQKGSMSWMKRNFAIVISACIALITMIFLPVQVILAAGGALGTLVGLLLVGGPVIAMVMIILSIPKKGEAETRGTLFIKLVICLILFWVLTAMSHYSVVGA